MNNCQISKLQEGGYKVKQVNETTVSILIRYWHNSGADLSIIPEWFMSYLTPEYEETHIVGIDSGGNGQGIRPMVCVGVPNIGTHKAVGMPGIGGKSRTREQCDILIDTLKINRNNGELIEKLGLFPILGNSIEILLGKQI